MAGKRDNAWTTLQELEDLGEEREYFDEELDDALLDFDRARQGGERRPP